MRASGATNDMLSNNALPAERLHQDRIPRYFGIYLDVMDAPTGTKCADFRVPCVQAGRICLNRERVKRNFRALARFNVDKAQVTADSVSYTHLTLPTSDLW